MGNLFYALAISGQLVEIENEAWKKVKELKAIYNKEIVVLTERSMPPILGRITELRDVKIIKTKKNPEYKDKELIRDSIILVDNVQVDIFDLYKSYIHFGVFISYTDGKKYSSWIADVNAKELYI